MIGPNKHAFSSVRLFMVGLSAFFRGGLPATIPLSLQRTGALSAVMLVSIDCVGRPQRDRELYRAQVRDRIRQ